MISREDLVQKTDLSRAIRQAPGRVRLSVLIPLHNEEDGVAPLMERLSKALDKIPGPTEIIIVNDGSTDLTADRLREARKSEPRLRLVHFTRNFGHQRAITAALDFAEGEACVIMDGDLQDPPELLPEMVKKWQEGYKVVYAVRGEREFCGGQSHLFTLRFIDGCWWRQ